MTINLISDYFDCDCTGEARGPRDHANYAIDLLILIN